MELTREQIRLEEDREQGDVAKRIQLYGLLDAQRFLEVGKTAGFVQGTPEAKEAKT